MAKAEPTAVPPHLQVRSPVRLDGSYTSAAQQQGACQGHKGAQDGMPLLRRFAPVARPTPPVAAAPTVPAKAGKPAGFSPAATVAPGGGTDMVSANASSKTYYCAADNRQSFRGPFVLTATQ